MPYPALRLWEETRLAVRTIHTQTSEPLRVVYPASSDLLLAWGLIFALSLGSGGLENHLFFLGEGGSSAFVSEEVPLACSARPGRVKRMSPFIAEELFVADPPIPTERDYQSACR